MPEITTVGARPRKTYMKSERICTTSIEALNVTLLRNGMVKMNNGRKNTTWIGAIQNVPILWLDIVTSVIIFDMFNKTSVFILVVESEWREGSRCKWE